MLIQQRNIHCHTASIWTLIYGIGISLVHGFLHEIFGLNQCIFIIVKNYIATYDYQTGSIYVVDSTSATWPIYKFASTSSGTFSQTASFTIPACSSGCAIAHLSSCSTLDSSTNT